MNRAIKVDESNQKSNANLDEASFSGRLFESSEDLWKEISLEEFMPQEIADLHKNGDLYLHDLSRFALGQTNCLTFSFERLFQKGIIVRNSGLRPPSRFSSACQLVAVVMQLASQHQFGGITAGSLDYDLAPFAEKSFYKIKAKYANFPHLTDEEVDFLVHQEYGSELKQGAEALVHNLSSL